MLAYVSGGLAASQNLSAFEDGGTPRAAGSAGAGSGSGGQASQCLQFILVMAENIAVQTEEGASLVARMVSKVESAVYSGVYGGEHCSADGGGGFTGGAHCE